MIILNSSQVIHLTAALGVLLHTKRRGKLDSVAEAIERIRRHGGWLAVDVVERVLALAGE